MTICVKLDADSWMINSFMSPLLHRRCPRPHQWDIMTSSNGNIFRVTGPLCGEFTGPGEFPTQRPVTRSFHVFFDLRLNKRLSKQPWGWWFETPSWSLWRQCYDLIIIQRMRFDVLCRLPPQEQIMRIYFVWCISSQCCGKKYRK